MNLYKYIPFKWGLETIKNSTLRFTQPKNFNDPFEVIPVIENMFEPSRHDTFSNKISLHYDKNMESALKKGFKENMPYLNNNIIDDMASYCYQHFKNSFLEYAEETMKIMSSTTYLQNISHNINEKFNQECGILCLSEVPNNIKMWPNYADNHKGIVLEFDSNNFYFDQRENSNQKVGKLFKVNYVDTRPNLTILDPDKFNDEWLNYIINSVIYTKSNDWKDEREWRMVLPLNKARVINDEIYLFEFPIECLTGIIFGSRTNQEDIFKVKNVIEKDSRYSHVLLKHAFESKTAYEIEIIDY